MEIMKQGSAEQLAENERRCKWSATLAALAQVPVGETMEFPNIALSETNRLRSVLHTSGRTSRFRWSVSAKTGVVRVSNSGIGGRNGARRVKEWPVFARRDRSAPEVVSEEVWFYGALLALRCSRSPYLGS